VIFEKTDIVLSSLDMALCRVLLLLTVEFAVGLGCFFALRETDYRFFVTNNRSISLKKNNGLKCSRVLCVSDNTVISCTVLCA
jgi:hypothetical protein